MSKGSRDARTADLSECGGAGCRGTGDVGRKQAMCYFRTLTGQALDHVLCGGEADNVGGLIGPRSIGEGQKTAVQGTGRGARRMPVRSF